MKFTAYVSHEDMPLLLKECVLAGWYLFGTERFGTDHYFFLLPGRFQWSEIPEVINCVEIYHDRERTRYWALKDGWYDPDDDTAWAKIREERGLDD